MPLADFLTGTVLLAAMLAATGGATALIARRRLAHLDPLERVLAGAVVATAFLITVHLVPLMLGVLSRGTALAAAALGVALVALVRPAPPPAPEERGRRPPSGPLSWALAAGAAGFALVAAVADLGRWAGDELVGVDPLTFHLPNVARWIQTGSVWQIDQFAPQLAHGNYPNNGDVVLLATVLPWHNDFLVRAPIALFGLLTAVAVTAVARELRAPAAASVLAGAAVVSIPIVGLASIPRALPDSLLWTMTATGVLFLLRHMRTGRGADLVLAGVALAIACGTKWYGLSTVAVVLAIWFATRLARERGARLHAVRDATFAVGLVALGEIVWLVRNVIESGNPVFPLKVAPFGVTIFDAPRDVLREQVGFTVSHYLGNGDIMAQLAGEVYEGLGPVAIVCALAVAAALVLGRRCPRVLALSSGAILLFALYTITPGTALGVEGDPSLASVNTRYAVPSLMLAATVAAWLAGRLPRRAGHVLEAALAGAAVVGATSAYDLAGARELVLALVAVVVLAIVLAAARAMWIQPRRPLALVAFAALVAAVGLAGLHRVEQRVNDARYLGIDPAVDMLLRVAPSGKRIGLASYWTVEGLSPIWPAFGTRIGNDVEYVGEFAHHGFLERYRDAASFQAALRRRRYDVLVVGRGFFPPEATPEQRWALDAGWRTIALSTRLRVLVPPGG